MQEKWTEILDEWGFQTEFCHLICAPEVDVEVDEYGAHAELAQICFGDPTRHKMPRRDVVRIFGKAQVEALEAHVRENADKTHPPARDWRAEESRAYREAV